MSISRASGSSLGIFTQQIKSYESSILRCNNNLNTLCECFLSESLDEIRGIITNQLKFIQFQCKKLTDDNATVESRGEVDKSFLYKKDSLNKLSKDASLILEKISRLNEVIKTDPFAVPEAILLTQTAEKIQREPLRDQEFSVYHRGSSGRGSFSCRPVTGSSEHSGSSPSSLRAGQALPPPLIMELTPLLEAFATSTSVDPLVLNKVESVAVPGGDPADKQVGKKRKKQSPSSVKRQLPVVPQFSVYHRGSSGRGSFSCRPVTGSSEHSGSSPSSLRAGQALPPPLIKELTPLQEALATRTSVDPLVLHQVESVAVPRVDPADKQVGEKRKRQSPSSVKRQLPVVPRDFNPSVVAIKRIPRGQLLPQKSKDPLLLTPASNLRRDQIDHVLTKLLAMLDGISTGLIMLTSDQEREFSIAYASDEYICYTELKELGRLDEHRSKVERIEAKISKALVLVRVFLM